MQSIASVYNPTNTQTRNTKKYTREVAKEKVEVEALTGAKTHAQIASEYGISPFSKGLEKAGQGDAWQMFLPRRAKVRNGEER